MEGDEAPKGMRGLAGKGEDASQDILEASERIFNQKITTTSWLEIKSSNTYF